MSVAGDALAAIAIRVAPPRAVLRAAAAALLAGTCLGGIAILAAGSARAVDGTWTGLGTEWTTGANWSSTPTVPNGTATFTSNAAPTAVTIGVSTSINTIQFDAGAPAYTFTVQGVLTTLSINGAGIVNNSAFAPTFILNRTIEFLNASTAGNANFTNNATLVFFGTSTAGNANITNTFSLTFAGGSTAGNATITNNNFLVLQNSSSAGDATITTNNGAEIRFTHSGSGGQARFITNAGGIVDLSLMTAAGTTAGSIEGAGTYFLGSKSFTVGSNNLSTTVSGVISDGGDGFGIGGSLTKVGTGTLTLAGANTYTGGTTVSAGTLALSGVGTLGAITNAITVNGATAALDLGGTTQTQNGGVILAGGGTISNGTLSSSGTFAMESGTVSAVLAGGGGVSKTTAGTVTFSGTNTYTGGTSITAGILQLGNGGATGAIVGNVVNNATLAFNRSNTYQFDGAISGSGGVQQNGGGTTILTAANTYAGGTSISAGILQLGNGGATGSIVGDVVNNATLAFNRSSTYQFDGAISGSGGVQQNGGGTTILTAANTYAGGTTINAGILQLGNGGTTGSIVGNVINNATLAFNRSNTLTFEGVISGTGGVQQNGSGTTVLTASNTYNGATTVNGGTLAVNGSIASSVLTTVNAGGTLSGIGTVGSTTVNNGGTLAPGNSIGTLTVQGNLVLTAAASYIVEVSPTNSDRTNVTGTATLGGTVQAVFLPGSYVTRSYTILRADGGLGGTTFNGLTIVPPGFIADLGYTATDVLLNLTASLGTAGLNQNQQSVAGAINGFFNAGGTLPPNFLPVFGLTGVNLANALTLLSGEVATGAQQGAFQLNNQFLGMMLDPFVDGRAGVAGAGGQAIGFAPEREEMPDEIALAYAKVTKTPVYKAPVYAPSFEQRWSVWGGAYGGTNKTSGDPLVVGSHDLTARTGGFAAGLDYRVAPGTVVGFALAGGGTNWGLANGLGTGKSDAFQAGLYGSTRWGALYVAAAFAYAWHDVSTDRFAFAGNHLTASFDAQSVAGRVEAGYRVGSSIAAIIPYAAVQAQNFRTPSYVESDVNAGGFGLAYNSRNGTATRSELGARADRLFALNPGAVLALRGRLAWAHDWVSDPTLTPSFQALPGASFIVNGATPAKDLALVSAGAELRLANGVTLSGKFDGEFAEHSTTYAGTGTIRYAW